MAYLEELLPEFRKGAKIRLSTWDEGAYIVINKGLCKDCYGDLFNFEPFDFFRENWELYKEPELDWDYIIKNKCLCWFWDGEKDNNASMGCLAEIYNEKYNSFQSREGTRWNHCIPVRRDEVSFYEDRKDE